jgi:hypothetical protein
MVAYSATEGSIIEVPLQADATIWIEMQFGTAEKKTLLFRKLERDLMKYRSDVVGQGDIWILTDIGRK